MKQLPTLLLFIFSLAVYAQQGVNYKALVKDGSGNVLVNQTVTTQFTILEGVAQSNIYQETHSTTTDSNGIVALIIGTGTTSDIFSDIDWSVNEHSLNVQIDSGTGLVDLGTTSFQSVPYAKYAENISASLNDLTDSKVVSRSIYIGTGSGSSDNGNDNQNTGVGDDAMKNTVGGAQNVAIGESTLLSNTSGEKNTVVGQSAMRNNTSGNRNTVIGEDALYSNSSGSGNVAIGNQAGRNATGSDKLYIDNSNTNNPLIWGDFTDGSEKVQINGELEIVNKTIAPEIQITTGAVDGHVLTSDASGNGSWQLPSGGSGADNDWTVSGDDMSSTPTGNVGIGTPVPNGKLHIFTNNTTTVPHLELTETTASDGARIIFNNAEETVNSWTLYGRTRNVTANSRFNIHHLGTGNIMTVTGDGNLGVGTSSPTEKLEVNGKIKSSELQLTFNPLDGYVLTSDASGNASWQAIPGGGGGGADNDWTVSGNNMLAIPTGNVGIGTNNPAEKLEVVGKIKASQIQMTSGAFPNAVLTSDVDGNASWSNNSVWSINGDGHIYSNVNGDINVQVGIGTNLPAEKLDVRGKILASEGVYGSRDVGQNPIGVEGRSQNGTGVKGTSNNIGVAGVGDWSGGSFTSTDGWGLTASTQGSAKEAIRSTASGNNGIGVLGSSGSSTGSGRGVEGFSAGETGLGVYGIASGNNSIGVRGASVNGSGIGVSGTGAAGGFDFYANGSGTDYGAASSIRWKTNIVKIDNPLDKLSKIRGVYYDWDEAHGGTRDMGMIAEEVGAVLPEIVNFEANGIDAIGMDYGKLTPLLVEVTKEQQKIINAERKKVAQLEKQLRELTMRIEQIEATNTNNN